MIVAAGPAAGDEVDELRLLYRAGAAAAAGLRGGALYLNRELSTGLGVDDLSSAAEDPLRLVLSGTIDGAILGFALARLEVLSGGERLARLLALWVEPEARGVGLGGELLSAFLAWAARSGAGAVDAYALPGDRSTKNLFEAAGLSARLLVMHWRAPGDAEG